MEEGSSRGVPWSEREVDTLLRGLARGNAPVDRLMCPGTHRNEFLFLSASRYLARKGYQRDPRQCRTKFKKLRAAYYALRRARHGHPPEDRRPSWYLGMHQLWRAAGRPTVPGTQPGKPTNVHLRPTRGSSEALWWGVG